MNRERDQKYEEEKDKRRVEVVQRDDDLWTAGRVGDGDSDGGCVGVIRALAHRTQSVGPGSSRCRERHGAIQAPQAAAGFESD